MNRFAIDGNASFEIISVETLMGGEIDLSPCDGAYSGKSSSSNYSYTV